MRFDYLLWDFDGTLFDTYPALVRAIEQALAEWGVSVPAARIRALLATTLADTIDALSAEFELERAAFSARVEHYRARTTPAERPPFPGVIALCERFKAAGGANLLFTHRDRPTLDALLAWHQADHLFLDILTTEDGYTRKPDPAGFCALIERNAVPRDRALAVGERELDVQAGEKGGGGGPGVVAARLPGWGPGSSTGRRARRRASLPACMTPHRRRASNRTSVSRRGTSWPRCWRCRRSNEDLTRR